MELVQLEKIMVDTGFPCTVTLVTRSKTTLHVAILG